MNTISQRANGSGLTSAEQSMAGAGINTAAQIGATIWQGEYEKNENEKLRTEARSLANLNREDALKQNRIVNDQNQRVFQIEQKKTKLEQKKQAFDLRIARFTAKIQKAMAARQQLVSNAKQFYDLSKNVKLSNIY